MTTCKCKVVIHLMLCHSKILFVLTDVARLCDRELARGWIRIERIKVKEYNDLIHRILK